MVIAGIIAEYNPFHSGHAYMLSEVRSRLNADYIVVAMSGSFTQRGIPAFFDKFSRTRAALENGADIVIELPVTTSTGSSEFFATGGVKLLSSLGVTHIAFGSECGDITKLEATANLLLNETDELKELVKIGMASGKTYPLAVSDAVSALYPEYASILAEPNNTLALEYIKAIKKSGEALGACAIKREGAGFNDVEVKPGIHPSATALRKKYSESGEVKFLADEDLSEAIMAKLLLTSKDELKDYADVGEELANRIVKAIATPCNITELYERLKTKQITMARIKRALIHILLGIKESDMQDIKYLSPEYIRVLGIRKDAGKCLKLLTEASKAPVISRLAIDSKVLSESAKNALNRDLDAYKLYRQLFYTKYPDTASLPEDDYRGMIVI